MAEDDASWFRSGSDDFDRPFVLTVQDAIALTIGADLSQYESTRDHERDRWRGLVLAQYAELEQMIRVLLTLAITHRGEGPTDSKQIGMVLEDVLGESSLEALWKSLRRIAARLDLDVPLAGKRFDLLRERRNLVAHAVYADTVMLSGTVWGGTSTPRRRHLDADVPTLRTWFADARDGTRALAKMFGPITGLPY